MKQLIQELMAQAGTDTSGKWMSVDNAERFAELIVQECAKISLECGINLNREDFRQGIARNIKQHFGVDA